MFIFSDFDSDENVNADTIVKESAESAMEEWEYRKDAMKQTVTVEQVKNCSGYCRIRHYCQYIRRWTRIFAINI